MDAQGLLSTGEDAGSAHDFEPESPEEPLPQPKEENMPRNRLRHNESFDSIFDENGVESGDRQSISSRLSDNVPLMTAPHSTYNPRGTNDVYSTILIINAALGAGKLPYCMKRKIVPYPVICYFSRTLELPQSL